MAHRAQHQDVERFRTPDRSRRQVIRVGPAANDNRRPGGRRRGLIWTGAVALAAALLALALAL
jgi:hypothetical protein